MINNLAREFVQTLSDTDLRERFSDAIRCTKDHLSFGRLSLAASYLQEAQDLQAEMRRRV